MFVFTVRSAPTIDLINTPHYIVEYCGFTSLPQNQQQVRKRKLNFMASSHTRSVCFLGPRMTPKQIQMKLTRSLVIGDNDVKKDVIKLLAHQQIAHKFAFVSGYYFLL